MRFGRSGGALTMSPRGPRPSLRRGPEHRAHDRVRGAEAHGAGADAEARELHGEHVHFQQRPANTRRGVQGALGTPMLLLDRPQTLA